MDVPRQAPAKDAVKLDTIYPLAQANQARAVLSAGRFHGAAVLAPRAARSIGSLDAFAPRAKR